MFFLLQPRPPPSATPTDTLFPYTTHFRSPFGADICLPLSTCFSPRRASGRAFERQAIPRRRRELMNQRTAASTPSRLARATSILAATALLQLCPAPAAAAQAASERSDLTQRQTLCARSVALSGLEQEDRKSTRLNSSH